MLGDQEIDGPAAHSGEADFRQLQGYVGRFRFSEPALVSEDLDDHPAVVPHPLGLAFCTFVIETVPLRIRVASRNTIDLLGFSTDYFEGHSVARLLQQIYPDDRHCLLMLQKRVLVVLETASFYAKQTAKTRQLLRIVRATGEVVWMQVNSSNLRLDPITQHPVFSLLQLCEAAAPPDSVCGGQLIYELSPGESVHVSFQAPSDHSILSPRLHSLLVLLAVGSTQAQAASVLRLQADQVQALKAELFALTGARSAEGLRAWAHHRNLL